MNIRPVTLKSLRKRMGLSQSDLAVKTEGKNKISISTIKRIESAKEVVVKARVRVVMKLAEVLEVMPEDLAKEHVEQNDEDSVFSHTFKTRITGSTGQNMQMVEHIYGISERDQIAIAPLCIALLAEASLKWREEELKDVWNAIDVLRKKKGHLSFAKKTESLEEDADAEDDSINAQDIFGHEVREAYSCSYSDPYEASQHNPFADYLRQFFKEYTQGDKNYPLSVSKDELGVGRLPDFSVGEDEFSNITNEDYWAKTALQRGYTRIIDIPKKYMGEDMVKERVEWLCSQIPAAIKRQLEASLAKVFPPFPELEKYCKEIEDEQSKEKEKCSD